MTPYIFPGLKPPTSKFSDTINEFVAENGGRLHLADRLESELVKLYLPNYSTINHASQKKWTDGEIKFLLNYYKTTKTADIPVKMNRSISSINAKLMRLRRDGIITFKKL